MALVVFLLPGCGSGGLNDIIDAANADRSAFVALCRGSDTTAEQRYTIERLYEIYGLDPRDTSCTQVMLMANAGEAINLAQTGIVDVSPLSGFSDVTTIDISGNLVADLSGLGNLPRLTTLNASYNSLAKLPDLSALPRLAELDLSRNPLTELEGIIGISQVQSLALNGAKVSDWSPLERLPRLKGLSLDSLERPASLRTLPDLALVALSLDDNGLDNLAALRSVSSQLRSLSVTDNRLTSLRGLEGFSQLEHLDASRNAISSITSDQLRPASFGLLNLATNPLKDFSFLSRLDRVTALVLHSTPLSSLEPIAQLLPTATIVDLSSTQLTSLSFRGAKYWPRLKRLDVSLTAISSYEPLNGVEAPELTSFAAYSTDAEARGKKACRGDELPQAVQFFCEMGYDQGG